MGMHIVRGMTCKDVGNAMIIADGLVIVEVVEIPALQLSLKIHIGHVAVQVVLKHIHQKVHHGKILINVQEKANSQQTMVLKIIMLDGMMYKDVGNVMIIV